MPKGCSVGLMIGVLMFIIGLVLWFCSILDPLPAIPTPSMPPRPPQATAKSKSLIKEPKETSAVDYQGHQEHEREE